MKQLVITIGCVLMLAAFAGGRERPTAQLSFVVVKDSNGKPLRNAAVVLHPVKKNGDQALGGMELKTDEEGKTGIDGIPYGKIRVQVIAEHMQTFGQDYQINQPQMEITIKMHPPQDQYSIYH